MSALFWNFWTNRCSSPLRLRGGYWYILDVILKVHYLIDISLQETREEISQCRLRYFWECQDVFRHCSVASMLCFAAILFWRWFLTIIVASWRTMLKMFNDCCTMADNYCCTIIVQQSLTTIVAQWCWRFLMPWRKCKVDLSWREVDPSTWNQPIHPSQYTRSHDDDDTTEGKWGKT